MRPEVAIVGAGPVGCALALLLRGCGVAAVLVGEHKSGLATLRPIALSHASRLILERAGAWQALAPTPIEQIHVSQQGGFGRTLLTAADASVPALGYVTDYQTLLQALHERAQAS